MTLDRNALSRNARHLLKQLGDKLTLLKKGASVYDVDTGVAVHSYVSHPVTVVMVQYTREEIANDPTYVRDDRKAYVAPIGNDQLEVEIGDKIQGLGEEVLVVSVREVIKNPSSAMLFVCQVRG